MFNFRKQKNKIFEEFYLRQESNMLSSEGLTYYCGMFKDGNIHYGDSRTLLIKYSGEMGTARAGFSPVEIELRENWKGYLKIPIAEVEQDAFEIFEDYFLRKTDMDKKVWYHDLKLSEGETVKFSFWNDGADHAFLVTGFQQDKSWEKDYFILERGKFKTTPTATTSGIAKSDRYGSKWIASKKAQLVDREVILDKITPFMIERIHNLFSGSKESFYK